MDCRQARDWLLRADDPRPERCASAELTDHLDGCGGCAALAADLRRLEQAWRDLPLPAGAHTARDAFLRRLPAAVAASARPSILRRLRPARWAAAAVFLVAVGVAAWMLLSAREVRAAPDVVERLIDWNLNLAQAPSLEERKRLHDAVEPGLKAALARAQLAPEDRELSEELLANGAWLTVHDDPLAEADRFATVADKLLHRLNTAAGRDRALEAKRFTHYYCRVTEQGVGANLARAPKVGALSDEQKQSLKRLVSRGARRVRELESLLERAPRGARLEIRRALDFSRKPHRPKGPKRGP